MTALRALRDERGSLPMAMLLSMVLLAVGGVLTSSVIMGHRNTGFDRGYERAVQRGEAGVDRLAFMVRAGEITTVTTVNGTDYTATATPTGSTWVITGTGSDAASGRTVERTVEMRLRKTQLFMYGVYAKEEIKMVGKPPSVKSYHGTAWNTGHGTLGSNGPIQTNTGTWDALYPFLSPPLDYDSDESVQFIADTCEGVAPTPLTLTGTTVLPAGDRCVSDLTIVKKSVTTVTGPVRLFVFGKTTIKNDAKVNCTPTCVAGGAGKPTAADFQILTAAETPIVFGKGLQMAGAVFAPRAQCTTMPFVRIFGALTCRNAQLQRAFFQLHYDERLSDVGGGWSQQWREQ